MAYAKIRPRRGTLYEWSSTNPILAEGEWVMEVPESGVGTGLCKFKIGDGHTRYDDLPYAFDAKVAHAIYGGDVYVSNDVCIRSGTTEEWRTENPILKLGEITYDTDQKRIKVGDGVSDWRALNYIGGFIMEDIYDFGDEDQEDQDPDAELYDFGDDDEPD